MFELLFQERMEGIERIVAGFEEGEIVRVGRLEKGDYKDEEDILYLV